MKGKSKKSMVVLIVLLAIGFAAVTTTLTINGVVRLGANQKNFNDNLIFTAAKLTYSDTGKTAAKDEVTIADDGKSISFNTQKLTMIGESVTLTYDITNNSQYGAEFDGITCTVKNEDEQDVTAAVVTNKTGDYIKLEVDPVTENVASKGKVQNKTAVVTMIKTYVGTAEKTETNYSVTCSIKANASTGSTATTTSSTEGA